MVSTDLSGEACRNLEVAKSRTECKHVLAYVVVVELGARATVEDTNAVELGLLEVVLGKWLQQPEGEEHVGGDIKVPIHKAVMVCWLLRLVDES